MNTKVNETIKVIPLGGVGEIGKNMYLTEVDGDIFIVDAGLMFPEDEMLGIDVVIPDITYLIENKERVQAIFLTHAHEDHIGALSYLLQKINVPVYGTRLTIALAKEKMKEQDFQGKADLRVIHSGSRLKFASALVTFFKTNHSIPDSVAVCIHTSEGAIVHTGDFKFDQAASKLYQPEIGKMASIGEKGVLCLLSDSIGAENPGYTDSEEIIAREYSNTFELAQGRVIAACFATDVSRIQHIFNSASESQRKVALVGKSLKRTLEKVIELGYLEVDEELICPIGEIKQYADNELVILITGNQGEPIEALQKMARRNHPVINIQEGDTVLIPISPLSNSEVFINKTIDLLYRAGATVLSGKGMIDVSSHGSKEELKFMINLMKPKFFIPVHGEYKMLKAHEKIAQQCGITKDHIIVPDRGEVIEFIDGKIHSVERVPAGNVLIDGIGIGDVGNIVLRDRRLLSQDGVLIVVVTLNRTERKIAAGPEIISRGFVYVRESEELISESEAIVKEVVEKVISRETFDWTSLKQEMREALNYHLYNKTKRRPMIMPILMEVKN
ncbi:ribonuclease J [Bacillus sp. B15-48]|uniref:ribonuclease J n=1 Tax=Bacillus sp. B15-48 TaxID=1548601 RepID=UPI00193EDBD8|nr:ribonuclease J [Bacillus sp. B15-48]MBM4763910.1 RNase J family beta-CASP ribonuclease [Bacillus sp. B15-48]